jgi:hypothetical protein
MNDFETWWYHEGSGPPLPGEDGEEHCKRMCQIAWSNGAYMAKEAAANIAKQEIERIGPIYSPTACLINRRIQELDW